MTKRVITVDNLSKAYRIGLKEEIPDTFVGALTDWLKAPMRNFRRLRGLDTRRAAETSRYIAETADHQSGNGNGKFNSQLSTDSDIIWALRDVSLEIKEGEVIGIIGRNGAGKSTLLKILSRITEPTSGEAVVRGRVSSLLEVGTGFHPELTGRENVYMNGTILGMTKREIDRKFDEIVEFSGVEKFLDTPIKRYSSGMQVRLAFAVAAHLESEILIIDEVLAVGDAEFQNRCLGKVQHVAGSGRTVLFVSHNMGVIASLCRYAIILENGVVVARGPANEQVDLYLSNLRHRAITRLPDRTDRTGTGDVQFEALDILDASETAVSSVPVGATLILRMRLRAINANGIITKLALSCFSSTGLKMFHIDNMLTNSDIRHHITRGEISCKIPKLPLPPGEYQFNALVAQNGTTADHIDSAALLTVTEGDYFGRGAATSAHGGVMYVEHIWK